MTTAPRPTGFWPGIAPVPDPMEIMANPTKLTAVIVGPGRVGSTLMADFLTKHPDIFCFNETHEAPVFETSFGTSAVKTQKLIEALDSIRFSGGMHPHAVNARRAGTSPAHLQSFLCGVEASFPSLTTARFHALLMGYFATVSAKHVLVDKTPDYAHHLPLMLASHPDLRIVLMVRDLIPTIRSMMLHDGYVLMANAGVVSWPDYLCGDYERDLSVVPPATAFADIWWRRVSDTFAIIDAMDHDRWLIVRYEDLLDNPNDSLARLARFVGCEVPVDWLADCAASISINHAAEEATPELRGLLQRDDITYLRARLKYT